MCYGTGRAELPDAYTVRYSPGEGILIQNAIKIVRRYSVACYVAFNFLGVLLPKNWIETNYLDRRAFLACAPAASLHCL